MTKINSQVRQVACDTSGKRQKHLHEKKVNKIHLQPLTSHIRVVACK